MKMPRPALLCVLSVLTTSAIAQEGYICVADKAAGFSYNKQTKEWDHARFNVKESKYVLTKKDGRWQWKPLGKQYATPCGSEINEHGFLSCQDIEEVNFNRNTLRYQSVYPIGYVHNGKITNEGGDTPSIEIGRCTPM